MIEYKNIEKQPQKVKYSLSTADENGNNIILGIRCDGVYVLKFADGIVWISLKTATGYDLTGKFDSVKQACNRMIEGGGRILIIESSDRINDILLNAL